MGHEENLDILMTTKNQIKSILIVPTARMGKKGSRLFSLGYENGNRIAVVFRG